MFTPCLAKCQVGLQCTCLVKVLTRYYYKLERGGKSHTQRHTYIERERERVFNVLRAEWSNVITYLLYIEGELSFSKKMLVYSFQLFNK